MEIKWIKNFLIVTTLIGFFMILAIPSPKEAIAASPLTLTVMNPQAEIKELPEVFSSARLRSLDGERIGLINNTKNVWAMMLQPEIEKAIREVFPNVQLKSWIISHVPFENKLQALKEVVKASDGVILFLGD